MSLSNFMCSVHGAETMMGMVQAARKLPWSQASPQMCPQRALLSLSAPSPLLQASQPCLMDTAGIVRELRSMAALKPILCGNL